MQIVVMPPPEGETSATVVLTTEPNVSVEMHQSLVAMFTKRGDRIAPGNYRISMQAVGGIKVDGPNLGTCSIVGEFMVLPMTALLSSLHDVLSQMPATDERFMENAEIDIGRTIAACGLPSADYKPGVLKILVGTEAELKPYRARVRLNELRRDREAHKDHPRCIALLEADIAEIEKLGELPVIAPFTFFQEVRSGVFSEWAAQCLRGTAERLRPAIERGIAMRLKKAFEESAASHLAAAATIDKNFTLSA